MNCFPARGNQEVIPQVRDTTTPQQMYRCPLTRHRKFSPAQDLLQAA